VTSEFDCDCLYDSSVPSVQITPDLPKAGDRLQFLICLPESDQTEKNLIISIKEFDSDEFVLSQPVSKKANEFRIEVNTRLPSTIAPGYYLVVLYGPDEQELVSESLIVVDSLSLARFDLANRALQYTVDARSAINQEDLARAVLLFEKAADHYARADSTQCAGFALVRAAELAKTVYEDSQRFEAYLWMALRFLLLSADREGASDLMDTLVNSSSSISEAVANYVRIGCAVLETTPLDAPERLERQLAILNVATRGLPPAPAEVRFTENILKAMRGSQGNQYITNLDELLHLASSQIALYSPGVLVPINDGLALHSITFAYELQESSHAFAAGNAS
jgi:hypothetical protein